MPPRLSIANVSKRFVTDRSDVRALDDVSLDVADGEFVCLLGASGCGKSTLLDVIAGLTTADSGDVVADGAPVRKPGPERLVLFQEHALFPWLDVLGNVMFGLKLKSDLSRDERVATARRFIEMVGLSKFETAHVHELSGGMKQRVALARALVMDPEVLLMDEPFGALDSMTREQLHDDMQAIWARTRKTIIFVTHDVREAACLGDRVVLMSPRPGRIARIFDIDLPRPRDINSAAVARHAAEIARALRETANGGAAA